LPKALSLSNGRAMIVRKRTSYAEQVLTAFFRLLATHYSLLFRMKKNVAILLFDEVEVLEFAGPFEVLQ